MDAIVKLSDIATELKKTLHHDYFSDKLIKNAIEHHIGLNLRYNIKTGTLQNNRPGILCEYINKNDIPAYNNIFEAGIENFRPEIFNSCSRKSRGFKF